MKRFYVKYGTAGRNGEIHTHTSTIFKGSIRRDK